MDKKPIKRKKELQALSRDHHQGLLLSWKIRTALSKKIELSRIKSYLDWFYKEHLLAHFEIEEKYLFPVLGNEHELVKKAIADHRRLSRLFNEENDLEKSINLIEEELEMHIRFEERILFNEIQMAANDDELQLIEKHHHNESFEENTKDRFWL